MNQNRLLHRPHAPSSNTRHRPGRASLQAWLAFFLFAPLLPLQAQKVFPREYSDADVNQLEDSVAYILTLSEDELRGRVPAESGGIWFTDCPNCEFGSQDRGRFDWEPERPHEIRCRGCDAVYPGHPDYPDDRYVEVDAPEGTHRFSYWEDPDGYRIFFRAHADYLHRMYLESRIRDLGRLYTATGNERYARPAAILLRRFAEVVPGYAYIYDFPYRQKQFSPYTNNRLPVAPYRTSLWTRWAYNDIPRPLLEAYDALYHWTGWDDAGGGNTREKIEDDLFTFIVEFVLGFEDPLTNMSPRIWQDAIYAGRLLGRPEWVHESIRRFERMLDEQFLHDGHWFETSPSYHAMTINGMRRVMQSAEGYTDPDGYRDAETGRRFDSLDLARDVPQYGLAIRALERSRLPSGRLLPVNDTWAVHGMTRGSRLEPLESSESLLMPGLGVAILGAGKGENQVFSYLNFTSGTAHKQRDTLSLGMYAHGRELLPDIGYTHTRYRRSWASSMMSHNTVVVDGRESEFDADHSGNRPLAFAGNGDDFHLAAAESTAAYAGRTDRYRRTLVLLGDAADNAYLVDVFEIRGGHRHDYLLHGSADEDSTAEVTGVELAPYDGSLVNPGAEYEEPAGEHDEMGREGSFSFIRDLRRGTPRNGLTLDLRLSENPAIGIRTILAPVPDSEVFLGRSPSLRRAAESDARINDYSMPSFVLRRQGEDLNTLFVAAHEPVDGNPRLESIRTRQENGRLWIAVRHAGGRDYLTVALDEPARESRATPDGRFATDAAYAVVRLDPDGRPRSSHLVGGTMLRFGDHRIEGPGAPEGDVRRVIGGGAGNTAFDVAETLPYPPDRRVDDPAPLLLIEFPDGSIRGYNTTGIEAVDDGTRIHVREAAGLSVKSDRVELTSFPQRTIEGTRIRYRLVDSAHGR